LASKKLSTVYQLVIRCSNGGIQTKMLVSTAGTTLKTSLIIRTCRTLSWKKERHRRRRCHLCDPSEFHFPLNLGLSVKMLLWKYGTKQITAFFTKRKFHSSNC